MKREYIVFWKNLGLPANKLSEESTCIIGFIDKHLKAYEEILDFNRSTFEINFSLCRTPEEKKAFLLEWFIKSKLQSLKLLETYSSPRADWNELSASVEAVSNKSGWLNKLFKKYHSRIKFIGESPNKGESISWLYKIQNKNVKKEITQLTENKYLDETTYLILTFRPKKILVNVSFGEINRKIEGRIKKPLSKIINLKLEFSARKEEGDFSKILEKIVSYEGVRNIKFSTSRLSETPLLEVISKKNSPGISKAIKELSNEEITTSNLEDINSLILRVEKRDIHIKLIHRKIAGYRAAINFEYNETKLSEKEISVLKDLGITNDCLYLDNRIRNEKRELDDLLNRSNSLRYYEQVAYEEIIQELVSNGVLKIKESDHSMISYGIEYEKIQSLFLEKLTALKAKKLDVKKLLGKKYSTIALIKVELEGENSLIGFFSKDLNKKTIQKIERKWLDGEIQTPVFISLKKEFIQELNDCNINLISLTDLVYSLFFTNDIIQVISSKLKDSRESYRLKYEKDLFASIKEIESILTDGNGQERSGEFERSTYVVMKSLFRDVVKMGGPNVPDGGLRFGIQNRALWDAKLWIRSDFCNNSGELEKIETYCKASKKKEIIQEFGGVEEYYLIGKIKDYIDLEKKVFLPLEKKLWKKYRLKIRFRYLDIKDTLLKLAQVRNSIPQDKIKDYNFYEKAISTMGDKRIILNLPFTTPPLISSEPDPERIKPFRKEVSNSRKRKV